MNSTFKEYFFEKKASVIPRANYIKLQQVYNSTDKVVHAFFENLDDYEFYRTAINLNYHGYSLKYYLQEGKQNVKDGFDEVDWNKFNKSLVLFFVDNDYDDLINIPKKESKNFFYTRWYSIENYLVTEESFEIVLTFFFTKMEDNVKKKLIEQFSRAHKQFQYKIRVLTRFILIFRALGKAIELDKITMDDFVVIQNMNFLEKPLISEVKFDKIMRNSKSTSLQRRLARKHSIKEILTTKCMADCSLIKFNSLLKNDIVLKTIAEPKEYVRGKYELWFFVEMVRTIENTVAIVYDELGIDKNVHPQPRKKTDVSASNAFHLISSKLITPPEIQSFLNLNFNTINGSN